MTSAEILAISRIAVEFGIPVIERIIEEVNNKNEITLDDVNRLLEEIKPPSAI